MTDLHLPSISVGIPTRDRPHLVRQAIKGIQSQAYAGPLEVVVVFDGTEPDMSLADIDGVRVISNSRTPGLAGARNSAITSTEADLVAFCDDDDVWLPGKLDSQLRALGRDDQASFSSTSIVVDYGDRSTARYAGAERITHDYFLRSRMSMIHSSTFLARRQELEDEIGLVDETIPAGQNEDWDLLLRASSVHPIAHVDQPLVRVLWGQTSFFSRRWDVKVDAMQWLLDHHPDLEADPSGASLVYGQMAFAYACRGEKSAARHYARKALRRKPTQWRAGAAALVSTGAVSGERVLGTLHRFGRGV
jgi:hypothetical protein